MTGTKSRLPTLIVVVALAAMAGLFFAGPFGGRDEPRWLRLTAEWTPTPRDKAVNIAWMVIGAASAEEVGARYSPWPARDVAVYPGEVLALRATQREAGRLSCAIYDRGRLVAQDVIDTAGTVECVASAA